MPTQAAPSNRHVVFIGVDGAQYSQILANASGMLAGLDHMQAYAGGEKGEKTQQPTFSGPGWSTLLTGVWANKHGITSNSNSPIKAKVDSLFERIDRADIGTIASIVNWADINKGHFARETGRLGQPSIVDHQDAGVSDAAVAQEVIDLIGGAAPVFTFAHLDGPDHAGHADGFGESYTQSLRDAGEQIRAIWAAVQEREAAHPDEEWLVIVSTDHGRDTTGYSHGGQSDSEREIFIASNREIGLDGPAPQTSVAASILDFLGLSQSGVKGPSVLDEDAADTHAPILLATRETATDLTLVLSETVVAGSGAVVVRDADGAVIETIDAQSDQVSITGGVVTVTLSEPLAPGDYSVSVDRGAFVDLATEAHVRLFSEDFESLAPLLQPYASPTEVHDGDPADWTATAPSGWTAVDTSRPGGVTEFAGWTFHDKDSWIETAGDQGRAGFTNGHGVVAVADPDEYYDAGSLPDGKFRTVLRSPEIDLTGVAADTITLTFDSSWRAEAPQQVRIMVSYDGAAPVEVMRWTSSGATAHADATDETVVLNLANPAGAHSAVVSFEMIKAGNDWWWAIDNIAVDGVRPGETHANAFDGVSGDEWTFSTPDTDAASTVLPFTDDPVHAPAATVDWALL